jgi:hypothetical protein
MGIKNIIKWLGRIEKIWLWSRKRLVFIINLWAEKGRF